MRLADGLRIGPGLSVAFVGAGGKTSAIRRLVRELQPSPPVLISTTTRFALVQSDLGVEHLVLPQDGKLPRLREALERSRSVLLTGPAADDEPKWTGLDPELLERMHAETRDLGTVLLIEADGARGRSLKAPAAHEPVIPSGCDLVVCLAGLDVLGERLSSGLVHRPGRVSEVLGLPEGHRISSKDAASVLASRQGGRKAVPAGAEFRVLLNKADHGEALAHGKEVAGLILESPGVNAVVIASLRRDPPVHEVWGKVAGIVLAAGGSTRLGTPKQLVEWRSRPLIWYPVRAAIQAGLSPVVVVLGAAADAVQPALAEVDARIVLNPEWATGQSSSVRAGLQALPDDVEAAMFLLADMPRVDTSLIETLIREHRRTLGPIVAPRSAGEWGNPVLFDRSTFTDLRELIGDRGGKSLFGRYDVVEVPAEPETQMDIDGEADVRRLRDLE
jgi:molybdenum cofactor cytidylyltransferase